MPLALEQRLRFSSGDDPESLATVGNIYDGTAKKRFRALFGRGITARDGCVYTAPVGEFHPNNFGLYDMHGNVYEWCSDRLDASAARKGEDRVYRGGGWNVGFEEARSAARTFKKSDARGCEVGFRVARSVDDGDPGRVQGISDGKPRIEHPPPIVQPTPRAASSRWRDDSNQRGVDAIEVVNVHSPRTGW